MLNTLCVVENNEGWQMLSSENKEKKFYSSYFRLVNARNFYPCLNITRYSVNIVNAPKK